ncbi:MAG: FAD-dependent oxidoreductase [Candidatus Eisenbacteria bacterium]
MLARSGRPAWRVVTGGSSRYVAALTAPWRQRIRLRTPVSQIQRDDRGVTLTLPSGREERFDHVILAVHSDQALRMLASPTPLEREVLSSIPYQRNEVVLHTDTSILPRSRKAWAAWNHHVLDGDRQEVAVTYWMNLLQGFHATEDYLVTLNATDRIAPDKVRARFAYHHPVLTSAGVARQSRQLELGRGLHTTYCGAYWGFGFHEDGVASAEAAVEEVRAVEASRAMGDARASADRRTCSVGASDIGLAETRP